MRRAPRGAEPYWGQAGRRRGGAIAGTALSVILVLAVIWVAVPLVQLSRLAHPPRRVAQGTPAQVGLAFATASFDNRSNSATLSGWWIPAPEGNGATAVLVAGQGQNRLLGGLGLPLARALHGQGWNVLMFDLQGTGQSQAGVALPGPGEVADVLGAVRYVRYRIPQTAPVVLLGYGWGGTVALLAGEQSPDVAGVLADGAVAALGPHLRQDLPVWTHLPAGLFGGLLVREWPLVTGIQPSSVDPLRGMGLLGSRPVLLVAGAGERPQLLQGARQLAAADRAIQLWVAPGAGYLQAWTRDHPAYVGHLTAWLASAASRSG